MILMKKKIVLHHNHNNNNHKKLLDKIKIEKNFKWIMKVCQLKKILNRNQLKK